MGKSNQIKTTTGHCLCKKIQWEFVGDKSWECYCHCDDCRRNCGAPVVAWLGVPLKNFRWVGNKPETFESSPGVFRHFCGTCGSPMGFEADHYAGGMHLYAGSLKDPADFNPKFHVNHGSKLPWLDLADKLEKHDDTLLHSDKDLSNYD